ncbi:hypothetical protein HPG69_011348 [Diceros bicornis minor]|uniref:Sodium/hydrogen exchanger n=1 Tax=Diceros bicornis minor TaxID=77932 RepID=A0A7J7FE46_DICBM|nr:hypothetical protein HPG69_011348 [Diceros bicornis minor]
MEKVFSPGKDRICVSVASPVGGIFHGGAKSRGFSQSLLLLQNHSLRRDNEKVRVFALFYVSNQFRTYPFSVKDQCVIFYSGVRGAGSFSLAFLLPLSLFPRKKMFVTATLVVTYFTVFIQGITIGPLVRYLDVKKTNKKESINEELHIRLMDHLKAGIEDVCGQWSHYQVRDKFKKFDHRYLRKILIRKNLPKSSIVSLYKKLEMKQAIEMVETGMLSSTAFSVPHQAQRIQGTKRLSPEDVESMRDLLTHNMYQTPSYNKYSLKPQTSEKQAKEILIRRQNTLRESMRKGHSLPWGKPAGTKNIRYLSFPYGDPQPARRDRRAAEFTDNDSSDSEFPSITFNVHSRTGLLQDRHLTQEIIPMKSLHRGRRPSDFSYQRQRSQEEHVGGGRRAAVRPKPLFHVVDEEYESEEESEEDVSVIGSRQSPEHRPSREHYKSHSPLLRRK